MILEAGNLLKDISEVSFSEDKRDDALDEFKERYPKLHKIISRMLLSNNRLKDRPTLLELVELI